MCHGLAAAYHAFTFICHLDFPLTEKLDYFSAALAIMYALYYTVVRLFHFYPTDTRSKPYLVNFAWSSLCTVTYVAHVSYLTLLPRFDYTYNIVFNITVGMIHNILWLAYALPRSVSMLHRFPHRSWSYRPSYANAAALFVILTILATSLELFDFPPWRRVIDAHSLWHLATVPITVFWYKFLISDALDAGWRVDRL